MLCLAIPQLEQVFVFAAANLASSTRPSAVHRGPRTVKSWPPRTGAEHELHCVCSVVLSCANMLVETTTKFGV